MVFCFVQKKNFGLHESQNINFFCRASNLFPEFNIRLYDKNSESDYDFFPPPKSEYFIQQHWESEYVLEKKHNPPLEVKWSVPCKKTSIRINPYVITSTCWGLSPASILTSMYAGDFHPTPIGIYIRHYMYTVHAISNMTEIR